MKTLFDVSQKNTFLQNTIMSWRRDSDKHDKKQLTESVELVANHMRLLSDTNRQWLLYDIKSNKWPEWDGSAWEPRRSSISDFHTSVKSVTYDDVKVAFEYMHENLKHISTEDQQKLLFVIANLQLRLYDNLVVCNNCGNLLESTYSHDFQICPCGSGVFVDGGREPGFGRMGWGSHGAVNFTNYDAARKYQSKLRSTLGQQSKLQSETK